MKVKLIKIGELDNGFVITAVEDETLRTFNECNIYKYVPTFDDVLKELKAWSDKIDKIRKEGLDEKESHQKNR